MKAAIYARVSTDDQNCEMQLVELREFAGRMKWDLVEYVDTGISGTRASRPALDRLMADAQLRRFDVVICWKLDRFGRSVRQLVDNVRLLDSLGIRFLVPTQGIDTDQRSPAGKLLMHIFAAFAEFERDMIVERVRAGVKQHKANLKLGRIGKDLHTRSGKDLPAGRPRKVFRRDRALELRAQGKSLRAIAAELAVPVATVARALSEAQKGVSKPVLQTPPLPLQ